MQQAFLDEGALQCGYCTSGMILSATSLLRDKPNPSDDQILDGDEWELVPVRNVSAHCGSNQARRADDDRGGAPMNSPR